MIPSTCTPQQNHRHDNSETSLEKGTQKEREGEKKEEEDEKALGRGTQRACAAVKGDCYLAVEQLVHLVMYIFPPQFMEGSDSAAQRSAVSGKIMKMKVKKSKDDKLRDINRKQLLEFLNASM